MASGFVLTSLLLLDSAAAFHAAFQTVEIGGCVLSRPSLVGSFCRSRARHLYQSRCKSRGSKLVLMETSRGFSTGDNVEVKWQGEWWPATVQELRKSPSKVRVGPLKCAIFLAFCLLNVNHLNEGRGGCCESPV